MTKMLHGRPSAALIRLREEKERELLNDEETVVRNVGRLTEAQVTELFKQLRCVFN